MIGSSSTYRAARPASVDATAALASLGGRIATFIPALLLGYILVLWPLAFGDATITLTQYTMGWLAPFEAPSSSPLKQVAYPALFALAAACGLFTTAYRRIPYADAGVAAILAILVLALLSVGWSDFQKIALVRALLFGIILATLFLSVYAADSFRLMIRAIFVVLFVATLLNLWALATQPAGLLGHTGIYPQKNFFGWVAVVMLLFGLYHLSFGGAVQRGAALVMVVAAPLFLVASLSKTSLGLAIVSPAIALVLVLAARRWRMPPAALVAAGVLSVTLVYFVGSAAGAWTFYSVNETLLRDGTLTGRTDIWEFASDYIAQRPLLGWGYESFWQNGYEGIPYQNALGFTRVAPTGHNGYVDMLIHLGWVGFALKIVALLAMLSTAGRLAQRDARLGWLVLGLTVFALLHNNLESDLFISSNGLSTLVILMFAIALRLTGRREA